MNSQNSQLTNDENTQKAWWSSYTKLSDSVQIPSNSFALLVSTGDYSKSFTLTKWSSLVGRAPDVDIKVKGLHISSKHCKIFLKEIPSFKENTFDKNPLFSVWIEDISRNGTYLNDSLLPAKTEVMLSTNDTICLALMDAKRVEFKIFMNDFFTYKNTKFTYIESLAKFQIEQPENSFSDKENKNQSLEMSTSWQVSGSRKKLFSNFSLEDGVFDTDKKDLFSDFFSHYKVLDLIGAGAYAKVRRVINKRTGKLFALKAVKKTDLKSSLLADKKEFRLLDEAIIMKQMDHPNIIKLYNILETENDLCFLLEYANYKDLFEYITSHPRNRPGRLDEEKTYYLFVQILDAVHYLHKKKIIHRDLKPENILLHDTTLKKNDSLTEKVSNKRKKISAPGLLVKISDFGLSKIVKTTERTNSTVGTLYYNAPELVTGKSYDEKVDYWSLGVILYVMVYGLHPFCDRKDGKSVPNQIIEGDFTFPYKIKTSDEIKNLIKGLLSVNSDLRFEYEDITNSLWFKKYYT